MAIKLIGAGAGVGSDAARTRSRLRTISNSWITSPSPRQTEDARVLWRLAAMVRGHAATAQSILDVVMVGVGLPIRDFGVTVAEALYVDKRWAKVGLQRCDAGNKQAEQVLG